MNRRPLVCGVIAFVTGQLIGMGSVMTMGLVMAGAICVIWRNYVRRSVIQWSPFFYCSILALSFLGIINGVRVNMKDPYIERIEQQSRNEKLYMDITGTVLRMEPKGDTMILELRSIPDRHRMRVYLKTKDMDWIHIGDRIEGKMQIKVPAMPTNPGEFDGRTYYAARGIHLIGYADSCRVLYGEGGRLRQLLYEFRSKASLIYNEALPEEQAGIMQTMILGLSGQLDSELRELYQRNGISHILAISALHITILGSAVYQLLRRMGLSFPAAGGPVILFLIGYGWMTGFSGSTVRAVIMFAMLLIGDMIGRSYDMLTATAVSCICMLITYPIRILDTAFQLSFSAVITLGLLVPKCQELLQAERGWKKTLVAGILIQMITAPIIIHSYYQFPFYGWILNLIVIPLMTPLLICGILGLLAYMLNPSLGTIVLWPCRIILDLYTWLCEHMERLPGAILTVGDFPIWKIMIYYAMLVGVYLAWKNKRKTAAGIILCLYIAFCSYTGNNDLTITMLDIGQGDAILLRLPNREMVLMDGGSSSRTSIGKYVIVPAVKYYGSDHIDHVFVSHMDADHVNGILELIEQMEHGGIGIGDVILPGIAEADPSFKPLIDAATRQGIPIYLMDADDSLMIQGVLFQCLYPDSQVEFVKDKNNNSMVISCSYQEFSMLFTGDLEEEGERLLVDRGELREYDILKVGHHGSSGASSEEFLRIIHPEIAILSCGYGNSYGHPHAKTLERLEKEGSQVYRTDLNGAVQIRVSANNHRRQRIRIRTFESM